MFKLNDEIKKLKGVGDKIATLFLNKNIETINDLILFLPISYITYENTNFNDDDNVVLKCTINSKINSYKPRSNLLITKFTVTNGIDTYNVIAWNMRHLQFAFKTGDDVLIGGKFKSLKNEITLKKIENTVNELEIEQPIVATYSKINNLSNIKINKIIINAIDEYVTDTNDKQMLLELHSPTSKQNLQQAILNFKRLEFTIYYNKILKMKNDTKTNDSFIINVNMNKINEFISDFSYDLTKSQDEVIKQGLVMLEAASPMQMLLLGDVGSGKTIVSLTYCLAVLVSGGQVAIMLPTEILAKQVYDIVIHLFGEFECSLLVSSIPKRSKKLIKSRLETGSLKFVVGTQALLEADVIFKNLQLVIIDEQHRFGVEQRNTLISKGQFVNYCFLSATPIPRTLAHVLYGVIDILKITEKPANRKLIETKVYNKQEKNAIMTKITNELESNNQVFVITPLAYAVDDLKLNDSYSTFVSFQKYFEGKYNVGMINGQLNSKQKDTIMTMFKNKSYYLLIATTVIEVGVDIPGATTIVILNAERFGLATLHQLRGRVGRNNLQSYCLLLDESNNSESRKRLDYMETINDGLELATIDYMLRGMGELTGLRQSGNEDFKLFNLQSDYLLAEKIISESKSN